MFGAKKEEIQKSNYELQLENEKLKIESEILRFKLDQINEKNSILEDQLREARNVNTERIKAENESLKKEIVDLKFKMSTDTTQIEVETENKKMKAQIEIQKSENKHLKDLLDAYRSMPDVKNMVDSLSSLAVPHLDELKTFSKMISDAKVSQLCEELSITNKSMQNVRDELSYVFDRLRGSRF
ncbi:hypothetical protein [Romboutsia ilealis]|jgi:hypothetical protein|uniref:hypothetical protein n=1 Tax=Romboutsia ilealis TaxID=1115758 RepID=UPI0026F404B4|nr:hypothetical protein [Romboutsia ilealis]